MPVRRQFIATLLIMLIATTTQAADSIYTFVQADRLEYQETSSAWVWDIQGWIGGDYHKLFVKLDGAAEDGGDNENELQLLYSRAVSAYFDLQLGVRHDFGTDPSRTHAVIGLQGLAPQWFEIDLAGFVSEDGDLSASLQVEYDLLITQQLIIQPAFEMTIAAQDNRELGLGKGLQTTELDLRLRYEIRREIAPYIGLSWQKAYGNTADFVQAAGEDDSFVTWLAGLRLWF